MTPSGVQDGVGALDRIVREGMETTTVPGVAVGVVWQGEVLYAKGFGVRQVGRPDAINANTVFQLASVSKAISSTVVAAAVTQKKGIAWDDPIRKSRPGFALADPWVSSHVTIADMFSHRSGLPDHAGDLLEDLGYSQDQILERLRLEPLGPFRLQYAYTNYGLTEAGEAAASQVGQPWPELAQKMIFGPLAMTSSSYRFADLQTRGNRAALHVKLDGTWRPDLTWDVDRQAPAGGASSSINDLSNWMTMLLGGGKHKGATVLDSGELQGIWAPQIVRQPAAKVGDRTGFYGLGWNLDYDSLGRLLVQHSGAFGHGAATNVALLPSEQLGIVTLTNGYPVGLPEAINNSFLDQVEYGKQRQDWLELFGQAFSTMEHPAGIDYSRPPAHPTPPQANSVYTGTFASDYWGTLVVGVHSGGLSLTVGPAGQQFPLRHYSGDEFFFEQQGESATGLSGVAFAVAGGQAESLVISAWNTTGLGRFARIGQVSGAGFPNRPG